ncbi:ribosomal maturation YjgA family protein [Arthrobacter antibioticus]|uniref:ribosomal maturation YjgA family protein n=1 Tax=Arthrobacter sp. H35-MC1 TaxID=3046203 RepID=UPI0024BB66B4|nr:DUF2809 domain-containing protein [Arthrobacter sp. H35-MC1]MDJ0317549.1 DUF2809 domain-containing protein [Arthrobacter sp. H35-MC1]
MAFSKTLKTRRIALFIAATDIAVLGLAIHFFVPGEMASLITDGLYTVLLYLVLALILPKVARHWLALAAFAISTLIECAQLSGVPEQLAVSFPPSRLIFGTTFSVLDLIAYAVGAVAVYYADKLLSQRAVQWRAAQPE